MTWRGDTPPLNRVLASLPYLMPLLDAYLGYRAPLLRDFPALSLVFLPLDPLAAIYQVIQFAIPFGGLLLFFLLFLLVVRNEKIDHFIRFNTVQALILSIAIALVSIIWQFMLSRLVGGSLIEDIIFNVVFLGALAASIYSMVLCWMGRYPEIPTLSEAAYMQVR